MEKSYTTDISIILLAAGTSSRLGHPKQMLTFKGQTLLKHSLQVASTSAARSVIVVLGSNAEQHYKEIQGTKAHVVINQNWQKGMASSIRCGVRALMEINPSAHALILITCDQPYVTAELLDHLIAIHNATEKPIVTCIYADTFGPPTLFHHRLFEQLLKIDGDTGAKSIVKQYPEETEFVLFPDGDIDIDTETDYQKLPQAVDLPPDS